MTRLAFTETLREQFSIGSSVLLLEGSPVCWMETIRDAQPDCLLKTWLNYAKISVAPPENWDTTKTCGTDCCSLTILPRNTPDRLASENARGSFNSSVSVSRDPAAKPAKLMAPNRMPLKNYYQLIQDPTVQLWWEYEVHFQRHSSLMKMWAPKGKQPHVLSPSVRHKVGFFGALNLKTGQLVTQEAPTFSAQTFGDFIRFILQSTNGKIWLILDNARWHRSKDLQ
jgi:hypothetical protein